MGSLLSGHVDPFLGVALIMLTPIFFILSTVGLIVIFFYTKEQHPHAPPLGIASRVIIDAFVIIAGGVLIVAGVFLYEARDWLIDLPRAIWSAYR